MNPKPISAKTKLGVWLDQHRRQTKAQRLIPGGWVGVQEHALGTSLITRRNNIRGKSVTPEADIKGTVVLEVYGDYLKCIDKEVVESGGNITYTTMWVAKLYDMRSSIQTGGTATEHKATRTITRPATCTTGGDNINLQIDEEIYPPYVANGAAYRTGNVESSRIMIARAKRRYAVGTVGPGFGTGVRDPDFPVVAGQPDPNRWIEWIEITPRTWRYVLSSVLLCLDGQTYKALVPIGNPVACPDE